MLDGVGRRPRGDRCRRRRLSRTSARRRTLVGACAARRRPSRRPCRDACARGLTSISTASPTSRNATGSALLTTVQGVGAKVALVDPVGARRRTSWRCAIAGAGQGRTGARRRRRAPSSRARIVTELQGQGRRAGTHVPAAAPARCGAAARRPTTSRRRGVGAGQSRLSPHRGGRCGRAARRSGSGPRARVEALIPAARAPRQPQEPAMSRGPRRCRPAGSIARGDCPRTRTRRSGSQTLDEFIGQQAGARKSAHLRAGGARARRGARSRAAAWAAGPGQDDAGADRRARAGRGLPRDLGAGDRARRRSRGAAHQSASRATCCSSTRSTG